MVKATTEPGRGWIVVRRMRGRARTRLTTDEIMKPTRGDDASS